MKLIIDIDEDELTDDEIQECIDVAKSHFSGVKIVDDDILDKIRAEIDRQEKWLLQAGYTAYNIDIAFDAIKAVLAESEDKE